MYNWDDIKCIIGANNNSCDLHCNSRAGMPWQHVYGNNYWSYGQTDKLASRHTVRRYYSVIAVHFYAEQRALGNYYRTWHTAKTVTTANYIYARALSAIWLSTQRLFFTAEYMLTIEISRLDLELSFLHTDISTDKLNAEAHRYLHRMQAECWQGLASL